MVSSAAFPFSVGQKVKGHSQMESVFGEGMLLLINTTVNLVVKLKY